MFVPMRELCREAIGLMGRLADAQESSPTPARFEPIIERAMRRWIRRVGKRDAADILSAEIAACARTSGRTRGMPICYTMNHLREALDWVQRQRSLRDDLQLLFAAQVLESAIAHREHRPDAAQMARGYWDREAVGFRAWMRNSRRR